MIDVNLFSYMSIYIKQRKVGRVFLLSLLMHEEKLMIDKSSYLRILNYLKNYTELINIFSNFKNFVL